MELRPTADAHDNSGCCTDLKDAHNHSGCCTDPNRAPPPPGDFQPASAFAGRRPGFVFKTGKAGLGYYRDTPPLPGVRPRQATATKQHKCSACGKSFTTPRNLERHRCTAVAPPPCAAEIVRARRVQQDNLEPGRGNALQAAVATVLGRPLADVPDFAADAQGYEAAMTAWLVPQNLGFVKMPLTPPTTDAGNPAEGAAGLRVPLPMRASPGVPCVVRGRSPRGEHGHVVVAVVTPSGDALELVTDPHPDGTMIAPGSAAWVMFIMPVAAQLVTMVT